MNINFKKLQIHTLGLASVCLCLGSGFLWGIRPSVQARVRLQQTIDEVEHTKTLVPKLETKIEELSVAIEAKRKQILKSYPIKTHSQEPLIGTVSNLLTQHQIDLSSLREEANESTQVATMTLQATGNYERVLHFISDLRKLDRPTSIAAFSLKPVDALGQTCSIRITVHFARTAYLPDLDVLSEKSVPVAGLTREGSDEA